MTTGSATPIKTVQERVHVDRVQVHPTPDKRAWGTLSVRVAAFAGAIFFALAIIAGSLQSGAPNATDSGRNAFNYLSSHQDQIQLAAVLWGFAMVSVLVWLSGLFRALRKAEGGTPAVALVALAGGVLAAASTVLGALIEGVTAARISDLGTSLAGVFWTMYLLSIGATLFGLLLVIGATAVVCLRTRLFGRRFATASIVLTILSMVGASMIGYTNEAIQIVGVTAILLDVAWILVVSLFLWRDPTLAAP